MTAEQPFAQQIESVMQRGRTGEQDRRETTVLQDISRLIATAQQTGEGVIVRLLGNTTSWRTAMGSLREEYESDQSKRPLLEVLNKVTRAIPVVAQETLAHTMGLPVQGEQPPEGDHREAIQHLQAELDAIAHDRVFASLTDPRLDIRGRNTQSLQGDMNTQRQAIMKELALDDWTVKQSDAVKALRERTLGGEEQYAEYRSLNRMYTEAQIARFLDGATFRISRRTTNGINEDVEPRKREELSQEDTRARYLQAFNIIVEGFDTDITWDEQTRRVQETLHRKYGYDLEQSMHNAFVSRLFDGVNFQGKIAIGQDITGVIGLDRERDDSLGEYAASFARGVAIKTLVEGGDTITYINALNALPPHERPRMVAIAEQMYDSLPIGSPKKTDLASLVLLTHARDMEGKDGLRQKMTALVSEQGIEMQKQTLANEIGRSVISSVDTLVMGIDLSNPRTKNDLPNEFGRRVVQSEREMWNVVADVGRQMAWSHVVQDRVMDFLSKDIQGMAEGSVSTEEVANKTRQIVKALESLNKISVGTLQIDLPEQGVLPPELIPILLETNLARLLLSTEVTSNRTTAAHMIALWLDQAKRLGMTQEDVLRVRQDALLAVAAVNRQLPIDSRIAVQDGLAFLMTDPASFHKPSTSLYGIPQTYNVGEITQTGYTVDAPGVTTYQGNTGSTVDKFTAFSVGRQIGARLGARTESGVWAQECMGPLVRVAHDVQKVSGMSQVSQGLSDRSIENRMTGLALGNISSMEMSADVHQAFQAFEAVTVHIPDLWSKVILWEQLENSVQRSIAELSSFAETYKGYSPTIQRLVGPLSRVKHTNEYLQAEKAIQQPLAEACLALGIQDKLKIDYTNVQATIDVIKTALAAKKPIEVTRTDQAMEALQKSIPDHATRIQSYFAERTRPPYDPTNPDQTIDSLVISGNGNGSKQVVALRELVASPTEITRITRSIIISIRQQDSAWCTPVTTQLRKIQSTLGQVGNSQYLQELHRQVRTLQDERGQPVPEAMVRNILFGICRRSLSAEMSRTSPVGLDLTPIDNVAGGMFTESTKEALGQLQAQYRPPS